MVRSPRSDYSSSDSEFGVGLWEENDNGNSGGLEVALMGIGVAAVSWLGRRLSSRGEDFDVVHREYDELVDRKDLEFQDARETWATPHAEDVQSFATRPIELNLDATSETASSEALSSPGLQSCTRESKVQPFEIVHDDIARELRIDPRKSGREDALSLTNILTGTALASWCCCIGK